MSSSKYDSSFSTSKSPQLRCMKSKRIFGKRKMVSPWVKKAQSNQWSLDKRNEIESKQIKNQTTKNSPFNHQFKKPKLTKRKIINTRNK